MPGDRRWSDADRELVANIYHWNASRCRSENCPGALECCYAGDLSMGGFGAVLDALTAAGWRHPPEWVHDRTGVAYCPGTTTAEPALTGTCANCGEEIRAVVAREIDTERGTDAR